MTPQGQVPQAAPQGWFQKNWKWLVVGVLVASMMCCGFGTLATVWLGAEVAKDPEVQKAIDEAVKEAERQQKGGTRPADEDKPVVRAVEADKARVDCGQPGPGGVDCDIKRTGGEAALKACWDLDITCENGGVMTGHACGDLDAAAEKASVTMPVDAFENQEACDVPARGQVKNLELQVQ